MEVVDQCFVDKNDFELKIKQLQIDNDQLLNQIMSQEIMHIAMNSVAILDVNKSCVDECELKNKLRKLKGKNVIDTAVSKPVVTIALRMFKLNLEPLAPEILQNKDVHKDYIKHSRNHADIL
nr:hypothetical protein [Tanacetum cinerariifolium]